MRKIDNWKCPRISSERIWRSVSDKWLSLHLIYRVKEGPCPNYLDVCCYDPMKSSETTNISYDEKRTICGHWNSAGVGFRITGNSNNEAQFGEFPWMMAILKLEPNQSKTYLCGGSLIHPKVVLTAVHCVHG